MPSIALGTDPDGEAYIQYVPPGKTAHDVQILRIRDLCGLLDRVAALEAAHAPPA